MIYLVYRLDRYRITDYAQLPAYHKPVGIRAYRTLEQAQQFLTSIPKEFSLDRKISRQAYREYVNSAGDKWVFEVLPT